MELAVLDVLFRLPIFLVERFTILVESSRFDVMFSSSSSRLSGIRKIKAKSWKLSFLEDFRLSFL